MECSYRIRMNKTSLLGWIGKLKTMVCKQLQSLVVSIQEVSQESEGVNGRGSL